MSAALLYPIASAFGGLALGALLARLLKPAPRRTSRTAIEQVEFMRNLLAFLLVAAFVGAFPALMIKAIPKENEQLLTYMLGQLSGMATTALGFYFVNKAGQDAVDAKRADNTGKMAEAVTTALKTGGGEEAKPDFTLKPGETAQAEDQGPRPAGDDT